MFNQQTVLVRCVKNSSIFLAPLLLMFSLAAQAQVPLGQISVDAFTNSSSQHKTEVEPYAFAFGNTIVATFQEGRYPDDGGASDNGWATSSDGGVTWRHGTLPGLTTLVGGTADRVSDPSVTFDALHGVWLIGSLPLSNSSSPITAMLFSRSTDGTHWHKPVSIPHKYNKPDKTWVSCDGNTGSPFYGHCYAEWDDNSNSDTIYLSVSTDGGITWGTPVQPAGAPIGLGLQPLAQPNGTVIAASSDAFLQNVIAVTSTNGGASWGSAVTVSNITYHFANGGLRDLVLTSSAMDAAGKIYVVWQDCRFRSGCPSNDLVMSTSTDGHTWTTVQRIPIDPVTSAADHFIPGLAVEPGTSGSSAHLGLTYYFYPNANCSSSTCTLEAGYVSSSDGGSTWTAPTMLAGMKMPWLPSSSQGSMVGDYETVVFVNGKGYPVIPVAKANSGSTFNEAMYVPKNGLEEGLALYSSEGEKPVPNAHSDHLPRTTPACDSVCGEKD